MCRQPCARGKDILPSTAFPARLCLPPSLPHRGSGGGGVIEIPDRFVNFLSDQIPVRAALSLRSNLFARLPSTMGAAHHSPQAIPTTRFAVLRINVSPASIPESRFWNCGIELRSQEARSGLIHT